ncbi:hypothetical protein Q5P01_016407 [Channa striata]|uniref:Ig-like domain-containing protein n=1 Tax=Channa striata TaxID=64152 RepID=A0AA88ME20_CHASR|nr:hypothetical protein Q5P01_016407 [Channa striata]
MPAALWRAGLLLSFLGCSACLGTDCVLVLAGQPVSLPCLYRDIFNFGNFSLEWRRDDEVVFRSVWERDTNVEEWSINSGKIPADALLTGNLSLELPAADPKEDKVHYSLFIVSGENLSTPLCTTCLRIAASFSSPLLQREEAAHKETTFLCHSSGGFPEPAVYWLIDDTEEPPQGSVRTLTALLPDSHLYNITSHLTVNISQDSSVSCIIENQLMNETLTSTSYVPRGSTVVRRASEAMWMFSTAMCVAVGLMVMAGVVYQIHLDRKSKKKEYTHQGQNRGYKRRRPNEGETEAMTIEAKETDV